MLYLEAKMPCTSIIVERFFYITLTDALTRKLRCHVNQSLRKHFSISHLLMFYLEVEMPCKPIIEDRFSISYLLVFYLEVEMPYKPIIEERFLYINITDVLSGSVYALQINHWKMISLCHTYWYSIRKLRRPVKKSLRKDFPISHLLMLYPEVQMPCKPITKERFLYIALTGVLPGS